MKIERLDRRQRLSTLIACGAIAGALAYTPVSALAAPPSLPLLRSATTGGQATAATPLTLTPESGVWDLSRYDSLYLRLKNPGKEAVTVWARAENPEAKGAQDNVRMALVLEGGQTRTLRLRLTRRPENPTYAPFKPFFMYFKDINIRDNTVDPAAIARVVVWLEPADARGAVTVEAVSAEGEGVAGAVPFFPVADKYGQYIHADWPGKIYSDADFAARRKEEEAEMRVYPGPSDWNQWGGWKGGPKQEATGFFYPKKIGEKWWLVDPEGCLFWSYGPTGVGFGEGTPVTDRESWFASLPAADGDAGMGRYWGGGRKARFMYYQDKEYRSFDFSGANAERKYGKDWEKATAGFMHRRLRNWGFNTIGNWSNGTVMMLRKTPYTVAIHYGGPQLNHIPDVFDPEFERAIRARMEQERGKTANDPWNLGYFVDNEWTWGYQAKAAMVTHGALRAPATSASKKVFVADLKTKYGGDIAALNTAWGSSYASWEALLESQALPVDTKNPRFGEDCGDFGMKFTEKYFATVRDAVKSVAPNNLYLGCRFHGHIDLAVVQTAAKYCDVISYNIYEDPNGRLNQYKGKVDKPFIVGEFGVGSDLAQMPWRGAIYSHDPLQRVRALEDYVRKAMQNPMLVGAHFFQFRDQPLTGRGDGEATLRGFVNTADTPHFELVQTNRRLGYGLYQTRDSGASAATTASR